MKLSLDIKGELIPHIGFLKAPTQPVNNKGGPRPSAFLGFALLQVNAFTYPTLYARRGAAILYIYLTHHDMRYQVHAFF